MNKKSYFEHARKDVIPLIPKSYSKVLEIGCGAGTFRQNLNKDCEYWGIEPNTDIAISAKNLLDNVLIGTYDEVCNKNQKTTKGDII
jgi:tRNA G46 methylase TrmB